MNFEVSSWFSLVLSVEAEGSTSDRTNIVHTRNKNTLSCGSQCFSFSRSVFQGLPSVLCCLFQSISKLWLKSLHYLISLIYTSSPGPRWFSSHSSRARALPGADRRGHCTHALEDTEDCLVLNGNISLWLSHAGAH